MYFSSCIRVFFFSLLSYLSTIYAEKTACLFLLVLVAFRVRSSDDLMYSAAHITQAPNQVGKKYPKAHGMNKQQTKPT